MSAIPIEDLERKVAEFTAAREVQVKAPGHQFNAEAIEALSQLEKESQDILQKYHAAMRSMEVRLEVLNADLKLKKNRNPIHHIESRLKSAASIYEKLGRYGVDTTLEDMESYIMDIAGLRVIVSYVEDAYTLLEYLKAQGDLTIVNIKDYIAKPKENGYRSLHLIVKIPVYFMEARQDVPVEIQIRSIAMDFWASLEHDMKYKRHVKIDGIDPRKELLACSKIIESVENRMQVMAHALDAAAAGDSSAVLNHPYPIPGSSPKSAR